MVDHPGVNRRLLFRTALSVGLARLLLLLSAPEALLRYDEATWKHGSLARVLADGGSLDAEALIRLATHPFNYHQVAFIPWNLAYAAFAGIVGTGFVQLHLFIGLSAVLGAVSWVALLERHAGRRAALLGLVGFTFLPLPAALLSLRPWSGHVEAHAFAAAALALTTTAKEMGKPRALLSGLLAGMALSLSPLALPLLLAGALLFRKVHPIGIIGLLVGLVPYGLRAIFAPTDLADTPVLEDPESLPGAILQGDFGSGLHRALWPPFHLVFHADSIPIAHSWMGLPEGDSLVGNALLVVLTVVIGHMALRKRDTFAALLSVGPWLTLLFIGLAGPDLTLRYGYGIYPMGIAAIAWAGARLPKGLWLLLLLPWAGPGALDLYRSIDLSRAPLALTYTPDRYVIPLGLDATPPLHLWPDVERILKLRAEQVGQSSAFGLGALWKPEDSRSAIGWLPPPPTDGAALSRALGLLEGKRADGLAEPFATELPYKNLGAAVAIASRFDAGLVGDWLQAAEPAPEEAQRRSILEGAAEAALVLGHDPRPYEALSDR